MTIALRDGGVMGVVLDIEGTTTPVSFVYDVLFPFARRNLGAFLAENVQTPAVREAIGLLAAENADDLQRGEAPPELALRDDSRVSVSTAAYCEWLMDRDRKSPGLKKLQGLIWERGYRDGVLQGEVFPDVPPALERFRASGIGVAIYSSGSVLAQRLIFGFTRYGDLTHLIDAFFDTGVGPKRAAESYARIAEALGTPPNALLFLSDVPAELEAARAAGVRIALCIRPGNAPATIQNGAVVHSFDEIA